MQMIITDRQLCPWKDISRENRASLHNPVKPVTRDVVEDSNAEENQGFNNKMKQMNNKNHPEGEKQAGRQKTGAQSNI